MSTDTEPPDTWPELVAAAKERVLKYQMKTFPNDDKLPDALAAFVDWLPQGGRESIARDILNATSDKELYDVYWNLLTGLAAPMKARSKLPSVTSSPHLKRQNNVEAVAATLDEPESRDPKFRELCLERDGNRCVVSGNMDFDYWEKIGSPGGVSIGSLEAAHIIPFAYASWDKPTRPPDDTASAWEVLWQCFPNVRRTQMRVENINSLRNGLTLSDSLHLRFGKFEMAFKPTDTDNRYEVKVFKRFPTQEKTYLPVKGYVEFTKTENADHLELPSRALLDCHYRLAEILNASGMAEVIEDHLRDWEDLKGSAGAALREDGSTDIGGILRTAFWASVVC